MSVPTADSSDSHPSNADRASVGLVPRARPERAPRAWGLRHGSSWAFRGWCGRCPYVCMTKRSIQSDGWRMWMSMVAWCVSGCCTFSSFFCLPHKRKKQRKSHQQSIRAPPAPRFATDAVQGFPHPLLTFPAEKAGLSLHPPDCWGTLHERCLCFVFVCQAASNFAKRSSLSSLPITTKRSSS